LFFVFIGFVSFWCSAQSINQDPKITGTWEAIRADSTVVTYVFNADGTGKIENDAIRFGAYNGKIVYWKGKTSNAYDYFFYNNGQTLMLINVDGGGQVLRKKT
jgi:hypothetical protein